MKHSTTPDGTPVITYTTTEWDEMRAANALRDADADAAERAARQAQWVADRKAHETAQAAAEAKPAAEEAKPAADTKPTRRGPRNGSRPVHSPRPRRFRRTRAAIAKAAGYLTTAAVMTRNGIDADTADRYSAQITRTAAKNGVEPTAITYTKRNGKARATRAYNLATDGMALLLALVTYRPAAPKRLKNGQPSRAKTEQAKAQKLADYTNAIGTLALVG